MNNRHDNRHLTAERIQPFLDGVLPDREAVTVREHVRSCVRCRADVEAWQLLFGELSELGRLDPSPGLQAGVFLGLETAADARLNEALSGLGYLEPTPAFAARVLDALGGRTREAAARVPDAEVEALLAGVGHYEPDPAFAARVMDRWQARTAGQTALEQEIDGVFAGVGHFSPSPAMAHRVMAQVRVGAVRGRKLAPIAAAARSATGFLGSLIPKTRRAWAIISGVAVTPLSIVALLAWTVFSNPLATPGNVAQFAWWRASSAFAVVSGAVADFVTGSPMLARAYVLFDYLLASPAVTAAGGLSLGLLGFGSLWVLYRNLMPTRSVETRYGRVAA